jgi:hypothetical protein
VRIAGAKHPPPQTLQVRLREHYFHQPLREAFSAVWLEDVYIREVAEARAVGDHPREADLILSVINAEGERILYRPLDNIASDARRPVRLRQKVMNRLDIETVFVGAYLIVTSGYIHAYP